MPVSECIRRVSYREYLGWMERFKEEWNSPSRTDYYLMQIAMVLLGTKKGKVDDLKIPFKFKSETHHDVTMTAEQATAMAKARWHARLGVDDGKTR